MAPEKPEVMVFLYHLGAIEVAKINLVGTNQKRFLYHLGAIEVGRTGSFLCSCAIFLYHLGAIEVSTPM